MSTCPKHFVALFFACWFGWQSLSVGQSNHNQPPINYETAPTTDAMAKLRNDLEQGSVSLTWDEKLGWLPSLLNALDIAPSSQTLVFSKTSQQIRKIRPTNPRAIYFNDEVYVGFVPKGDFLEIAAVDPNQGAIFYTLEQTKNETATIKRASSACLACHENSKTQKVPGFVVRSVFPKRSGHPDFRRGTTATDHRTPFIDRFGGWYVTGQHGTMRHRGNVSLVNDQESTQLDRESGANRSTIPNLKNRKLHLRDTSDIVALMVLEHQTQFHNHVTKASFTTRQALHYQSEMNRILEREPGFRSESTTRRIERAAQELVEYLFFKDEFKLESPVKGIPEFQSDFASKAQQDGDGRSLRDFDLQTRMLKYPCSWLVYSESFNSLPQPTLNLVVQKMKAVLGNKKTDDEFTHLSLKDRQAILEILQATHPLFKPSH